MKIQLGLLVLKTKDPALLADFYSKLGLQFEVHQHGKGPIHYCCELEEMVFEIYPLPKNQHEPDKSTRLGFKVENLDNLVGQLIAENIQIVSSPKNYDWGYSAIIEDLDGRKVELTQLK